MKKITPPQLAILKELAKPDARAHYMPWVCRSLESYYFVTTTMKRCTVQIVALIKAGLAERCNADGFGSHQVRISDAGRKYLKEQTP